MPPSKLLYGSQVTNYLGGSRLMIVFKISGLATGDDDSWQLELRPKGDPHPLSQGSGALYPGALCRGHQLIRRINPTTVLGAEVYVSNLAFSGGPRNGTDIDVDDVAHEFPIYKEKAVELPGGTTGIVYIEASRQRLLRARLIRTETRFLNGNLLTEIQQAIALNLGRYYQLEANGPWYILSSRSRVSYDGQGRTAVQYGFSLLAAFPPVPALSIFGNDLPIPELPWNHVLAESHDPLSGSPVLTAVPVEGYAVTGEALPGL